MVRSIQDGYRMEGGYRMDRSIQDGYRMDRRIQDGLEEIALLGG